MRRITRITLLVICPLFAAGCCAFDHVPPQSLNVVVYDADLGRKMIADTIAITATDGSFSETYLFERGGPLLTEIPISLVYDRPGNYDVLVEADGYLPFLVENVRVRDEGFTCKSVKTVTVRAPLIRRADS